MRVWPVLILPFAVSALVAACGSGTSSTFDGGASDSGGDGTLLADSGPVPVLGSDAADAPTGSCKPKSCTDLGYNCGPNADGCGNMLDCGACMSPEFCGGGGYSVCGGNTIVADGGSACTAKTCAQQNLQCGPAGDGCGNQLDCGTCTAPSFCGGGGFATCGGNASAKDSGGNICVPKTCAQQNIQCGPAGDGCGNQLNCGSCMSPAFCGGGGFGICGGNSSGLDGGSICKPKACAQLGYTCGPAGDGCGNQLNCGTCTAPEFCGGGGPSVCGPTNIVPCDGGVTTLTGYVYDPANNLPVYNALVYIPVGAVVTPQTGINPPTCGCAAPSAYAAAYTGIDGKFTLTDLPSGAAVQVVVQLGKWQRVFSEAITSCKANVLASHLTLPSTRFQGNIPRFAIDTGNVDTMECVLLKMGIAQSEFVDPAIANGLPTDPGRVQLYEGSIVAGGAVIDGNTPTEDALTETAGVMDAYDVILFPCQGAAGTYTAANGWPNTLGNLVSYADNGGRAFTTHYHYDLLDGNGSFSGTANWTLNSGAWGSLYSDPKYNALIDTSFARGNTLAQWLNQPVVYGGTVGQIPVGVIRNDFSSVNAPAQRWMYTANDTAAGGPGPNLPVHYTFDTPFNQSPTCGRVVYSDFHVESEQNLNGTMGMTFPSECPAGGMTPQEKLLEFMIFDLTSCVSPPTCTKLTCAQQGIQCGPAGDGCGGLLQCGPCVAPQTCGGGGVSGQCGSVDAGGCTPGTCTQQGIQCGPAGDGCGNLLQCGNCTPPLQCGGGGQSGVCGFTDSGACAPRSCAQQGISCGPAGDGCGNLLQCGPCVAPQTCGGGGMPGVCGDVDAGSCTPTTCAKLGISCGPAGDGCGGLLQCGTCLAPQTCGGGGQSGVCGGGNNK